MELAWIILRQTLLMSLYMLIGYLLYKGKKIDAAGSRSMASMLVWVVIPATVLKSCLVPYSAQRLTELTQCFLLAAAVLALAMAVSRLCFQKDPIAQFSGSFSNAGFIGIPLVQASLGDEAVFYLLGIIILLNLLQWTYGAGLLKGEKTHLTLKMVLLNPVTAAAEGWRYGEDGIERKSNIRLMMDNVPRINPELLEYNIRAFRRIVDLNCTAGE